MIETTEPAEASISARIEELTRMYQERLSARQKALEQAQSEANDALRLEGAIGELTRWLSVLWGPAKQGEANAGE